MAATCCVLQAVVNIRFFRWLREYSTPYTYTAEGRHSLSALLGRRSRSVESADRIIYNNKASER
eukprot:scaffold259835_cov36-Tisochrysis_lutea.AAC.4